MHIDSSNSGKCGRIALGVALVLGFLALGRTSVFAAGLSTRFGEVTVTNLCIGHRYSMEETAKLPLAILNTSAGPVELRIDPMLPAESELKNGYEPIPDLSWIGLEKNLFTIPPNEHGTTDIFVTIPNERELLGKKFQVFIWSRTIGTSIGVGLKSKLLFDIAPEECDTKSLDKAVGDFDFVVEPEKISLHDVKIGKTFDMEKEVGVVLKITNKGKESKNIKIECIDVPDSYSGISAGYRKCPAPSLLTLRTSPEFDLAPGSSADIRMYLDFPGKDEYADQNYVFLIKSLNGDVSIYTPVYVSTTK
ncbi:hypothetical protein HZA56_10840 [Candidatus Poribacteria bacterium]|nr:hypothetical protein [Candidatus Poribacteria bacterium]